MSITTVKYRKPIPFKVFAAVFIIFTIIVLALLFVFVPPVRTAFVGLGAWMWAGLMSIGAWLITLQFIIGVTLTAVILSVIVARKYIFAKKVHLVSPAVNPLASSVPLTSQLPETKELLEKPPVKEEE